MGKFVYKLIRLPVDLLLLTSDFFRMTEWLLITTLTRAFGVFAPPTGPLCRRRLRGQTPDGERCCICGHADRYGNRWLFQLLCPWLVLKSGVSVCSRRTGFRQSLWRYVVVLALLTAVWGGLGYGLWLLLL